tara:strand:- start:76 stop:249 length:174 start_codon:yes stop_codon:yes gene_type:complete
MKKTIKSSNDEFMRISDLEHQESGDAFDLVLNVVIDTLPLLDEEQRLRIIEELKTLK